MHSQGSSQSALKSNYFRLSIILAISAAMLMAVFHESLFTNAAGPPSCITVSATGAVWQNSALVSPQPGTFTAVIDATPLAAGMSGGVGCEPGKDPTQIMTGPNLSVFIRNDDVTDVRYKRWSIREIAPQ
jgi:hypothetical protein